METRFLDLNIKGDIDFDLVIWKMFDFNYLSLSKIQLK